MTQTKKFEGESLETAIVKCARLPLIKAHGRRMQQLKTHWCWPKQMRAVLLAIVQLEGSPLPATEGLIALESCLSLPKTRRSLNTLCAALGVVQMDGYDRAWSIRYDKLLIGCSDESKTLIRNVFPDDWRLLFPAGHSNGSSLFRVQR